MKHVRMLGLIALIAFPLTAGCDDNSAVGGADAGGVGGNSSKPTGGTDAGGSSATNTQPNGGAPDTIPEVAGTYVDDYGEHVTITADVWQIDTSIYHITILDNAQDYLIAANDEHNPYDTPGTWSRFDWIHDTGDAVYYCQTAYNASSEKAAQDTPRPSLQNFPKGCGVGSWSKLTPTSDVDAGH